MHRLIGLLLALFALSCGTSIDPRAHSPRFVQRITGLRVSESCAEHLPAIRSARDAWEEAGFSLPFVVVPPDRANVHCIPGRFLDRQGVTKWGVNGRPAITLMPIALGFRVVAMHEIGHALAGDARHARGIGVMTSPPTSSEITVDDVQVVLEGRFANW